ncbi:hypothetical protein [Neptuniibacter halophilus]|uniref:hypothetical protein n=1 Tax=Neptuniibacter halophilus TaxID=651666 RepID=UPI002572EFFF|nr:hypothetical protein [Neptuniibacter halophilus]
MSTQHKEEAPEQEKPKKRFKSARMVGSEVSGFTFIKRGIAAHVRAGQQGYAVLKTGAANVIALSKEQPMAEVSDISLVERQIKQANSLYSTIVWFGAVFLSLITVFFTYGPIAAVLSTSLEDMPTINIFSMSIGFLAIIYFLMNGYLSLRDFRLISRITPAPSGLTAQYRATYTPIATTIILMNACAIIMQLAPGLSYERAAAGLFTVLTTIGVIQSVKNSYNPTKQATKGYSITAIITRTLTGRSITRYPAVAGDQATHPTVVLITTVIFTGVNLCTKESSLLSLFNLFGVLIGLAALVAMSIHAWGLDRD